jgi:hypothetical protein
LVKNFTCKLFIGTLFLSAFCGTGKLLAQQQGAGQQPIPGQTTIPRPGTQQSGQQRPVQPQTQQSAQNNAPADTTRPRNTAPLSNAPKLTKTRNQWALEGLFDVDPPGTTRTVEYDLATNTYIIYKKLGNLNYGVPLIFKPYRIP